MRICIVYDLVTGMIWLLFCFGSSGLIACLVVVHVTILTF